MRWIFPRRVNDQKCGQLCCPAPYVTGARHQEFKAAEWSWIRPSEIGLLRKSPTNWYRLIMNILNRSCDPAWLRGATTDVTNARTCHFSLSGWQSSHSNFHLKPSQLDSTNKKPIRSGFLIWSAVFLSRQDPLEAILVIFGRRALFFFFLFESSWKKMKNDTTFVRMRSGDHLGDAKMSKKGTSLRRI